LKAYEFSEKDIAISVTDSETVICEKKMGDGDYSNNYFCPSLLE
jgi:hypothetical protein